MEANPIILAGLGQEDEIVAGHRGISREELDAQDPMALDMHINQPGITDLVVHHVVGVPVNADLLGLRGDGCRRQRGALATGGEVCRRVAVVCGLDKGGGDRLERPEAATAPGAYRESAWHTVAMCRVKQQYKRKRERQKDARPYLAAGNRTNTREHPVARGDRTNLLRDDGLVDEGALRVIIVIFAKGGGGHK